MASAVPEACSKTYYDPMSMERIRNLGIVAHIDAGKTTVSERILFYSGLENRMGEVHEGSAVLDWMDEERRRGITICSAASSVPWRDHRINLIDTPGHVDFTVEVERCMRVLDAALLVVNGVSGVQAQSETVWRQIQAHGVAAIAFVNHLDRPGADFLATVEDLEQRLEVKALPIQYPLLGPDGLLGVVDLLSGRAWQFQAASQGRATREIELPAELRDEVEVLRWELVEALAEGDEGVMEAFLEERLPSAAALGAALRQRVIERSLLPVLGGSALRNKGIQPLLDAVVDYLPSPLDAPVVRARLVQSETACIVGPDPEGPTAALAFKLQGDGRESLLFTRIYRGRIRPGQVLYNPRLARSQRVEGIFRMHGELRSELASAGPGDIVALTGCGETSTGDTLCSSDEILLLEPLALGEPVLTLAIEPVSPEDFPKLRAALGRLCFEDPSFRVREDPETGQWLMSGMGELQLEIKQQLLCQDHGLALRAGLPQVAYREAPSRVSRAIARVDRSVGEELLFGCVELELRPMHEEEPRDSFGLRLVWSAGESIPDQMRAALGELLLQEASLGPRFGFPLGRMEIHVIGGASNPERDTELGFLQAASQALREALQGAEVLVWEPLMSFEVEAPVEFMSAAIGRLNANGAQIRRLSADGKRRRVMGTVALATMFGFATQLRSLSQGRASFTMLPAGFQPLGEEQLSARGLS